MNINSVGKLLLSLGATACVVFGLSLTSLKPKSVDNNKFEKNYQLYQYIEGYETDIDEDLKTDNISDVKVKFYKNDNNEIIKHTTYVLNTIDTKGETHKLYITRDEKVSDNERADYLLKEIQNSLAFEEKIYIENPL